MEKSEGLFSRHWKNPPAREGTRGLDRSFFVSIRGCFPWCRYELTKRPGKWFLVPVDNGDARKPGREEEERADRMDAIGLFAGGIAHDLNNMLSGILGYSSYLMSKAAPDSSLRRDLGLLHESALRVAELMRQLSVVARRHHLARAPVDVNELVRETLAGLRPVMPEQAEVELELAADLPPLPGDRAMLQQALTNLCLRAADEMEGEKGKLAVATARESAAGHDAVVITVSDTGPALSPEALRRFFDPFFSTGPSQRKTGLELAVVYGVVANHGGRVTVESGEGTGTRCRLVLPVETAEARGAAAPAGKPACTETVLVVDDEPKVRQMVVQVLKMQGYQVVAAASGEEAVEVFRERGAGIALVLLDLIMPGMGGEAAFDALRELAKDVRVLLTSVAAQETVGQRLIRQGAKGMILKPYTSDALLAAVREALNGKA